MMKIDLKAHSKKLLIIIPVALLFIFIGIRLYTDLAKPDSVKKMIRKKKKAKFKIISPIKKTYTKKLSYFGNLEAIAQVDLYSREESRIVRLFADISDRVTEGQLLAQINDTELNERKKQKEAALSVARATARQDKILARNKKLIYQRTRKAFYEKIIPEQELDDAKTSYEVSLAQASISKARVREAYAYLEELNVRLNETKIVSPINGVIVERYLDQGALVKLNQPIFKIIATDEIKLLINIAEKDLSELIDKRGRIRQGIVVNILVETLNRSFKGHIYKIYPTMDTKTRTITVEVRLNNPNAILKPGFYCQADLNLGKQENLFLPVKAVKHDEISGKKWVQLVDKNRVILKQIKTHPYNHEELIVTKGLNKNDRLITPYNPNLKENQIINQKETLP